jgi:hypothetical protein
MDRRHLCQRLRIADVGLRKVNVSPPHPEASRAEVQAMTTWTVVRTQGPTSVADESFPPVMRIRKKSAPTSR